MHPDKFIQDNVVAPSVRLKVVIVTLPCKSQEINETERPQHSSVDTMGLRVSNTKNRIHRVGTLVLG